MTVLYSEPLNLDIDIFRPADIEGSTGGYNLQSEYCHSSAWCDNIFSESELDALINICESLQFYKGRTTAANQSNDVRDSNVKFIYPNERTGWIFDKLSASIAHMNEEYFGFELNQIQEGIQLTKYEAPTQHYTWHCDRGLSTPIRKLSVSIQLSDPSDYEGGDLELLVGDKPEKCERGRGIATFFPSWTLHRVTPVTSGTRYSMVCWISGPPFK